MGTTENFRNSIVTYFKGVRAEWGKVVWPEKAQVLVNFVWVLIVCAFFTTLIYLLDVIYNWLFGLIPNAN